MAGNADAVISGRNFLIYSKVHDQSNALPADSVAYGSAWSGWTDRGYTNGGLQFAMNLERGEIRVDQEFFPVHTPITGANITLSTELAEFTPRNLQLAAGFGAVTDTAAGASVYGTSELAISSAFADQALSWGYDIQKPDGRPLRIIIFKGRATGSPSPQVTPDNPATIALEIAALVDTSTTPARIAAVRDNLEDPTS